MFHMFDKNYKLPKNLKLDLGGFDSAMKEIKINLDKIAQDIRDRKDNAMAMEFTKCIGELLKKNGVSVKITEVRTGGTFDKDRNVIEERYGVLIDGLDFSEHDKVFENEIKELKQYIDELEIKKTVELPFEPLECANYIINATYERETNSIERSLGRPKKLNEDKYTIDELEQIAEHLLIYCKHNKETE